ncbi:MAG: hypothetical protein WC517_00685 [Patescibacteria group bacterium]
MKSLISTKDRVIKLRKKGYSYGYISQQLGLSKSTLSDWLREIPFTPNQEVLDRVKMAQLKSAKFKQQRRINEIVEMREMALEEIGQLSRRDLLLLGVGLYWGEGSKSNENVRIINSDPILVKLMIRWFRDICGLGLNNFYVFIHLYPDSNIDAAIAYWSEVTSIPSKQFGKIQIDKRTNKSLRNNRKLPYGTFHLQIRSYGNKEFGRRLHRRIIGWIEAVSK